MLNIKIGPRIPLSKLDIIDEAPSPLKRKAKIFARKLPQDFFMEKKLQLYSERSATNPDRNNIHTQDYSRKSMVAERVSETRSTHVRKGELSARVVNEEQAPINLLMGIISSTRQIRKSIRKHSLQLKKQPKFSNNIENIKLELPPLFLKKGATTIF